VFIRANQKKGIRFTDSNRASDSFFEVLIR
jgi:hypothetical protein